MSSPIRTSSAGTSPILKLRPSAWGCCELLKPETAGSGGSFSSAWRRQQSENLQSEEDYYDAITPKICGVGDTQFGGDRQCCLATRDAAKRAGAQLGDGEAYPPEGWNERQDLPDNESRAAMTEEIHNAGEFGDETHHIHTVVFQTCNGSECALWSPVALGAKTPWMGHCGLTSGRSALRRMIPRTDHE